MQINRRSLLAAPLLALPAVAQAQTPWPQRPVRLVVPYAAGGPSDIIARLLVPGWQAALGQPVVVDNRPGAGAMLGTEAVARANDGHTFLIADGPHTIIPAVQERVPYDAVADFVPITMLGAVTMILLVNANHPARSARDLVEAGRAQAEAVSFGSSGVGSLTHLLPEWLGQLTGARFANVPYRGAGPALQDVAAGQITAMFSSLVGSDAVLRGGQVRVIGVAAESRMAELPDVPTLREQGIPIIADNWWGLLAPAATPPAVRQRLADVTLDLLRQDAIGTRLRAIGLEPREGGPEPFARVLAADFRRWAEVARAANIRVR
ncbi:MAG: Bug family tripartite tricarboxylate transporter substrate binding protein [Alphaproteobacteria bacterium]